MSSSIFDVIGPVMIGPSSSHTAGAVRIGNFARALAGEMPRIVDIHLHGSFAATGKGHGTDLALVAGVLGLQPDDPRIKEAFELAREQGVTVNFAKTDIKGAHPNTARLVVTPVQGSVVDVTASSVGGGEIRVVSISGFPVELSGRYPSLIAAYKDRPGMVAKVGAALAAHGVNIAYMRVSRRDRGDTALMVVETDQPIPQQVVDELLSSGDAMEWVRTTPAIFPAGRGASA